MGSRWCAWCLAAASLVGARAALAEDIGREPLLPVERLAPAEAVKTRAASAGGPTPVQRPPGSDGGSAAAQPARRWYGWQTLVVDAVPAFGLIGVVASRSSSTAQNLVGPLVATYFVGPPIIHAAHGHIGKALLSLGIRSAGPLLILAGSNLDDRGSGSAVLIGIGALAIPAAIAVDAAAIAREDVPREGVPREESSLLRRISVAPWVDPKKAAGGLTTGFTLTIVNGGARAPRAWPT